MREGEKHLYTFLPHGSGNRLGYIQLCVTLLKGGSLPLMIWLPELSESV